MYYINPKTVGSWKLWQDYWVPSSLDTTCPSCCRAVSLEVNPQSVDSGLESIGILGRCPRCNFTSKVWIVGIRPKYSSQGCEEIWTLPEPTTREVAISADVLPFVIFDAYKEAIECFNAGFWRATVTECSRALESIAQDLFLSSEEHHKLKHLSEATLKPKEAAITALFQPLLQLSRVIHLRRTTGLHLNLKCEADREIAQEILEVTEYLLKYFYELSLKADSLESKIKKLRDAGVTEEGMYS
jgi:hypothetical protein